MGKTEPAIKICGLSTPETAMHAAVSGAWGVGVVFAAGPREVDIPTAVNVLAPLPATVARIGVFVDPRLDVLAATADSCGLTHIQLHSTSLPPDQVRANTGCAVILAVPFTGPEVIDAACDQGADMVLFDAAVPGKHGGTGTRLEWDALAEAAPRAPFGVAGGLDAANVGSAIHVLDPDLVDVSSGVESSPGVKDPQRITAFCDAVRAATRP